MNEEFDMGIIGGGPAGYTAAVHAANSGQKVVLFEKDKIGGVCLNKGCIPTKSILHSSEIYKEIKNSQENGITVNGVNVDYSKVIARKNTIVENLRKGIELALKNAKVTVINSKAEVISSTEIRDNEGNKYIAGKIIYAAGSTPVSIKGLEFDSKFILSSDDILNIECLPKSILIIGSGAIGTEWARIFSNFGVETTVAEIAPYLIPSADTEVSKRVERIFKANGIKFYTGTSVDRIENKTVTLTNGENIEPEIILLAAGRKPERRELPIGVKIIGDSVGEIQLAHYAIKQALEEVRDVAYKKELTPSVIYGSPEIAWIGKREQDLENQEYKKSIIPVSALGKSHCDGKSDGFIKLIEQGGKIAGAHIISQEASALIQQIAIAMNNNITPEKLKETCFAHPTYSEGIFECLLRFN